MTLPSPVPELPFEPPLSPEPVLGWRVWRLERQEGALRLVSVTRPDHWPPMVAMRARCSRGHPKPAAGCMCGLYAASSPQTLARAGIASANTTVVGAIAMWGTVVEHGRGARSEFAYPARLRLVCGTCIAKGAGGVDAVTVAERPGGLVAGCRRHAPSGDHLRPATEIQAELLATYAVDLLPIERVGRSLRRARTVPVPAWRGSPVQFIASTIAMLLRFAIGAFMTLMVVGWFLAIAAGVIGGVVDLFTTEPTDRAWPVVAEPSPLTVDLASPSAWGTLEAHRRIPRWRPPDVSDVAFVCGVQEGRAIRLMRFDACATRETSLLGFGERSVPSGPARDCLPGWDAYSRGDHFFVCWDVLPANAPARPWATSPNPFTTPTDEGGVADAGT